MKVIKAVLPVVALALIAGCGQSAPSHHVAATHVATASAANPSQSCAQQSHAWYQDQGRDQLHQVVSDEAAVSKDGPVAGRAISSGGDVTKALAQWQADATALETDAQSAAANPPPACADPGDYVTAMQDFETAAKDTLANITDVSNNDYTSADILIKAANRATARGVSALGRVTTAITQG